MADIPHSPGTLESAFSKAFSQNYSPAELKPVVNVSKTEDSKKPEKPGKKGSNGWKRFLITTAALLGLTGAGTAAVVSNRNQSGGTDPHKLDQLAYFIPDYEHILETAGPEKGLNLIIDQVEKADNPYIDGYFLNKDDYTFGTDTSEDKYTYYFGPQEGLTKEQILEIVRAKKASGELIDFQTTIKSAPKLVTGQTLITHGVEFQYKDAVHNDALYSCYDVTNYGFLRVAEDVPDFRLQSERQTICKDVSYGFEATAFSDIIQLDFQNTHDTTPVIVTQQKDLERKIKTQEAIASQVQTSDEFWQKLEQGENLSALDLYLVLINQSLVDKLPEIEFTIINGLSPADHSEFENKVNIPAGYYSMRMKTEGQNIRVDVMAQDSHKPYSTAILSREEWAQIAYTNAQYFDQFTYKAGNTTNKLWWDDYTLHVQKIAKNSDNSVTTTTSSWIPEGTNLSPKDGKMSPVVSKTLDPRQFENEVKPHETDGWRQGPTEKQKTSTPGEHSQTAASQQPSVE